jgi:RNA polymerase sigma-70 factor, ECF subfamily
MNMVLIHRRDRLEDQQAIRRLKQGDIDGLEHLVQQYQTRALHIAYLITQDAGMAEDVVQTAFVRVYEKIAQFDAARPFGPWFYRVVSNDAIKAAQGQGRASSLDSELPADAAMPDELLEQAQTRDQLRELLAQLSPQQRAVVVLRFYAGLRHDEIADQLDVPPATVRWRLHSSLRHLRHLMIKAGLMKEEVLL